jgi:hypothetical protein
MNYLRGTDNINENNSCSYLYINIYVLIICCYVAYIIKGFQIKFKLN